MAGLRRPNVLGESSAPTMLMLRQMRSIALTFICSTLSFACDGVAAECGDNGHLQTDARQDSGVTLMLSGASSNTMLWSNGHQSYFAAPAGHAFYLATATLTNNSDELRTTAMEYFTLETAAGAIIQATLPNGNSRYELMPQPCASTLAVTSGHQISCQLSFEISQGAAITSITYDDGVGDTSTVHPAQ